MYIYLGEKGFRTNNTFREEKIIAITFRRCIIGPISGEKKITHSLRAAIKLDAKTADRRCRASKNKKRIVELRPLMLNNRRDVIESGSRRTKRAHEPRKCQKKKRLLTFWPVFEDMMGDVPRGVARTE